MRVLQNFPFEYKLTNEEVQICCPFCERRGKTEDTKFHLYINFHKKVFHCFRCNTSGKFLNYKHLISILTGKKVNNFESSWEELIEEALSYFQPTVVMNNKKEQSECLDLDTISYPISPTNTPNAYNYLISRGLTIEDIEEYQIRLGKTYKQDGKIIKKWRNRILFPFFDKEEVIYIVGRSIDGREPKYLNSKGSRRNKIYPNSNITSNEVIVCEGIFDCITAKKVTGIESVACLGKHITEEQVELITQGKQKTIYLALDPDLSKEEWKKAILKFLVKGCQVYPILLPEGKDVNSLGSEFLSYLKYYVNNNIISYFLFT